MDINLLGISGAVAVAAVVEVAKRWGLPSKWAAPFALLVGALVGAAYALLEGADIAASIVAGVAIALQASGAYDNVKTAVKVLGAK